MAEQQEDRPQSASAEWQESDYEAALAHLEKLQEQLDGLRTTLPSLVAPLVRRPSTKAQMQAQVRKAAIAGTGDLKTFGEDWSSEKTQQLLARARESEQKDGDLSKAADVKKYGWQSTQNGT